MIRPILTLIASALLLWMVAAIPARRLAGDRQLFYSGTALLVCLVPAAVTLGISVRAKRTQPEMFPFVVLGCTGARLFLVSTVTLVLQETVPFFEAQPGFWFWMVGTYLVVLALEMSLLLSGPPAGNK